ncbi:hypothetical protein C8R44DRAFT_852077 [Mycena epipterygia]|nr:hypothetical protein C8R44DRAFT_852077 [Mycena epipterygia]
MHTRLSAHALSEAVALGKFNIAAHITVWTPQLDLLTMIIDLDRTTLKGSLTPFQSDLEPLPPPYEPPSAALLQHDYNVLYGPDAPQFRTNATRRRRFIRFFFVAVVLVVVFASTATLVRSYSVSTDLVSWCMTASALALRVFLSAVEGVVDTKDAAQILEDVGVGEDDHWDLSTPERN